MRGGVLHVGGTAPHTPHLFCPPTRPVALYPLARLEAKRRAAPEGKLRHAVALVLLLAVAAVPLAASPAFAQHNSWDPGCANDENNNPCGNAEGILYLESNSLPDRTAAAGTGARAWADNSTAFGHNARVSVDGPPGEGLGGTLRMSHDTLYDSTVMGQESYSWARYVTAVGADAGGEDSRATALGNSARATALRATAIGQAARASGRYSLAIGLDAQATAEDATALGQASRATAARATALGRATSVTAVEATALGHDSRASALAASAIGDGARAYATLSAVLGQAAVGGAEGGGVTGVTVAGQGALAGASNSVAIGTGAIAGAVNAVAIGYRAGADASDLFGTATNAVAVGADIELNAPDAIAFGHGAVAGAENAAAFGWGARANGVFTLAVGNNASASGASAVALGHGAFASHANAFALGYAVYAERDGQMEFGRNVSGSVNTYTLPGVASAESRAAQSGPVQLLTSDGGGNLAYTAPPLEEEVRVSQSAAGVRVAAANAPPDPGTFAARLVAIEATVGFSSVAFVPVGDEEDTQAVVPVVEDVPVVLFATEAFTPEGDVVDLPGVQVSRGTDGGEAPVVPGGGEGTLVSQVADNGGEIRDNEVAVRLNAAAAESNQAAVGRNAAGIRENAENIEKVMEGIAIAMALSAPPPEAGRSVALSLGYGTYEGGHALGVSGAFRAWEDVFVSLGGGLGLETGGASARAAVTLVY